jgi:hypothetical protein
MYNGRSQKSHLKHIYAFVECLPFQPLSTKAKNEAMAGPVPVLRSSKYAGA